MREGRVVVLNDEQPFLVNHCGCSKLGMHSMLHGSVITFCHLRDFQANVQVCCSMFLPIFTSKLIGALSNMWWTGLEFPYVNDHANSQRRDIIIDEGR